MKICSKCKKLKSFSKFHKHKFAKDGLHPKCKKCRNEESVRYKKSENGKKSSKKYYESEKGQKTRKKRQESEKGKRIVQEGNLRRLYNITLTEYDQMFEQQNGLCAICGDPEIRNRKGIVQRLAVDHDHNTGKIRGLLCSGCNARLGIIEDEIFNKKAKQYLEK